VGLALGFKIGGLSNWYEYLKLAKFLGGDKDRLYGSTYSNTIYWQIVGEKMYYQKWFVEYLKNSMLLVNVYYFFFRQWCLPTCITNLLRTFSDKRFSLSNKPSLTWAG